MKTTLDLPDDLVRQMKLRALMQGSTFKDLAADFLRQGLGLGADKPIVPPSASSVVKIDANGLPFVDCNPKAKVRRMNAQALVALEQSLQLEEDRQRLGNPL